MKRLRSHWFLLLFVWFIVNRTERALFAQDASPPVSSAIFRPNFQPTRFWIVASPTNLANSWDTPSPEILSAVILDVNDEEIVYASETATSESRLPAARVQAIDVIWGLDDGSQAHSAFLRDDFKSAIELAQSSIANGKLPRWQQCILAAEIAESLTNLNQHGNACRVFISLGKESPAPLLYASAPLNWTSERTNATHVQLAKDWMGSENDPISQLLGASWLLIDSSDSQSARTILEKLGRSKSAVIAQLATAQLWRDTSPNEVVNQVSSWAGLRDRMLLPLQIGPTIAIAHKLQKAGQAEAALQEWLRVMALFPSNHRAAKQARNAALELLKALGRTEEAQRMIASGPAEVESSR